MNNGQGLAEFEARVAMEPLTPEDFFGGLRQLLAAGHTTPEGAEALRLAYLANPLNADGDKLSVRDATLPDLGHVDGEPETEARGSPQAPTTRGRGMELATEPPAATIPADVQERDEVLATLRPSEPDGSAEEAVATWQATQAAFQGGQWEEARRLAQSLAHLPAYAARVRDLLRALDHHEDFVLPQLQGLAAGLTSARRREAWQDVDQIWQRAQAIVEEEHRQGVPARLPSGLVEQYTRAKNAQEAKPLVQEAVQLRRRGEFVESDSLLAEAVKLDPDNAVILAERERCSLGMVKLASLQSIMGKAHVAVPELISGLEDAASLEQLAPDGPSVLQVARSFRRLREETAERLARRADQLLEEIDRRAGIGEKWSLCGEASRSVDDLLRLAPETDGLGRVEERLERLSGQVTRAQDIAQGLKTALDAVRASGAALTPIQAGRLAADLIEAQSIAPDDLDLRAVGTRIAEAISLSLSSPEYLLRDSERFDLSTFYSARELVRLLSEGPSSPGQQTVEGYRHALTAKGTQAVVTRLDRGLAEDSPAGAQGPIEEALQLALALSSLPGAESLQAASELVDRVTGQVRRWIYLRFLGNQTLEDVERTASQVADMLVHLRSLPGTPADTHADLEREFLTSIQQSIRHLVAPEILRTLPLSEAVTRVARCNEFITYSLPAILQRLGHPERARAASLLEVLAHAQEHIDQRQGRSAAFRSAAPLVGALATIVAIVAVALAALPGLRPGSGAPAQEGRVFRPEPNLAGVQGYDCEHIDDHNVCDVPSGPQFKTSYRKVDVRGRLGSPLSSQLREGQDVQYFQYGRLEYHPQNPEPYNYQYGLLGTALASRRAANDPVLQSVTTPVSPDPNKGRYYQESRHHISDVNGFLRYFDTRGGVYAFGYPVTEEFQAGGQVIQYFQFARFEGRAADPTSVRLGNVGVEYLQEILGAKVCHRIFSNLNECG
ncbi:MAG: hypothetical protein HY534_07925 [Chloroflexi bacterium]|nr:hypothetical protein [Chloroflexota bacterium]